MGQIALPHHSPVRILYVVKKYYSTEVEKQQSPDASAGEGFLQMTQIFKGVNYVSAGGSLYV